MSDIIKEYYDELKPDMSYQEFRDIVVLPFKFLKHIMSSDEMGNVRFRYIGTFKVVPGYVVATIIRSKAKGRDYTKFKNYVLKHKEDFEKHKKRLWSYLK